jgi:hypothetical protein
MVRYRMKNRLLHLGIDTRYAQHCSLRQDATGTLVQWRNGARFSPNRGTIITR